MFKIFEWINWIFGGSKQELNDQTITVDRAFPEFEYMTKRDIDAWASENGIEIDGRWSKARMIEFLEKELNI